MSQEAAEQLAEELGIIETMLPPDSPATRRIAIRSMFASLEALSSAIMSSALRQLAPPAEPTTCEARHQYFLEVCALSDIAYEIDQSGDLKIQPPRIRFQNRILFALKMRAKASGVTLEPKQVAGWSDFLDAVKIRNRVVHPGSESDIVVSEDDYQTVVKGAQWFVRCNHRACGGTTF
jgi:hypothetical protein